MQRIISWNVASVRSRLPALEKFLKEYPWKEIWNEWIKRISTGYCIFAGNKSHRRKFPFYGF